MHARPTASRLPRRCSAGASLAARGSSRHLPAPVARQQPVQPLGRQARMSTDPDARQAFENPVADGNASGDSAQDPTVARDPTAAVAAKSSALAKEQSSDAEIAGVDESPESMLDGAALGCLGPESPLRVVLFQAFMHRFVLLSLPFAWFVSSDTSHVADWSLRALQLRGIGHAVLHHAQRSHPDFPGAQLFEHYTCCTSVD